MGLVCRQRAFFGQCVFKFVDDDDDAVYARPTFIRQSPFVVGFVSIELVVEIERLQEENGAVEERVWNNAFTAAPMSYTFSDADE